MGRYTPPTMRDVAVDVRRHGACVGVKTDQCGIQARSRPHLELVERYAAFGWPVGSPVSCRTPRKAASRHPLPVRRCAGMARRSVALDDCTWSSDLLTSSERLELPPTAERCALQLTCSTPVPMPSPTRPSYMRPPTARPSSVRCALPRTIPS